MVAPREELIVFLDGCCDLRQASAKGDFFKQRSVQKNSSCGPMCLLESLTCPLDTTCIIYELGERQSIAQKGVRAIDTRKSIPGNGSNATKTSVRAPGLSTDEREHPFV